MGNMKTTRKPMSTSEKILWTCAALAAIAALILGPIVGGTRESVIIPLLIAGLIAAGAFAARRRRLTARE